MHQSLRSLDELPIGESAVVHRVACQQRVGRRLMEMGLLPGTRIEMVRRAPLGDPLEIRLRGYLLSLRRADASGVSLTPDGHAAAAGADAGSRAAADPGGRAVPGAAADPGALADPGPAGDPGADSAPAAPSPAPARFAAHPPRSAPAASVPRVLVAGNANSGKTTIFNALTGARARVGNYPG